MTLDEIRNFRQWGSNTAGHPEYGHAEGIETTTGPLGQGLASAVGMAIGGTAAVGQTSARTSGRSPHLRLLRRRLPAGRRRAGSGISLAGHLRLGKLIVLYDDNSITIDGPTSLVSFSEDVPAKFRACGWHVKSVRRP